MALDKLVDSTQLDNNLTSVANAIRAKSGGTGQLAFPSGFVSEIGNIPTGGGGITPTGTKEITITKNGTTTEDVTNYASAQITVSVPSSGGGGVDRGTFTPSENTLTVSITVTKTITGIMIIGSTDPYTAGSGVRTCGGLMYDTADGSASKVALGSNASGNSGGASYNHREPSISQSGNTVTIQSDTSFCGYFIAGVTYRWIAW